MDRVIVVGPSGSGKTTLARELAAKVAVPHTELDALWWDPNWTETGEDRFRARVTPVVAGDRWVIDGNYFSVGMRELAWPRADTIVWLDFTRRLTIARIVRRTIRRSVTRTELWSGNREHLGTILGRDELLRFAWRNFDKYRTRYAAIGDDPTLSHLTVVRLENPRTTRAWLTTIGSTAVG